MTQIVLRRLALAIPQLFIVSVITFVLQSFIPGDPARTLLGVSATPEQYEALRQELHLDDPIASRYWLYLQGVLRGDLGTSIFTGDSVNSTLAERLPVSLSLIVLGTLVAALIGTGLGVLSATRGPWLRRVVDVVSVGGGALPNFWVALVLASIFAVTLGLLPATGYVPFADSPAEWATSLVLPVAALCLFGIAVVSKVVRDGMLTALGMDYMRTLRASGVPERSIVWRHGLRSSGVGLLTIIGVVFITSLSGTVLVEQVFVLPGLGSLAVSAVHQHDLPVIQGVALTFTAVVIVINLIVDVAYGLLDPKVRVR